MSKIIQNFRIQNNLSLFSEEEIIQKIKTKFLKTDIGKIYTSVPWGKLIKHLGRKQIQKGRKPIFTQRGEIALLILKTYTGLSDKKLTDQINKNTDYQIFCDLPIGEIGDKIKDYKIISKLRVKLSNQINWNKFQEILINNSKEYIKNKGAILIDATCYETDMRYPTDAKLLWECLEYTYKKIKVISKSKNQARPRSKYKEIEKTYKIYSRRRRKSYKMTNKIVKKLLYITEKLYNQLEELQTRYNLKIKEKQKKIERVLEQQKRKYEGEEVKSKIVSLSKPYIRPIVRGKEIKRVEFGAKVNKIQIDGINIVEHINYEAFNEGIRYKESVERAEQLTGEGVKITGADSIYATNNNRTYARARGILTDFKRKGKAGRYEKELKKARSIISKTRSTKLEGSFGVEKRIYGLERIKARTEKTETLMIYIGIWTKNLLEIGRRMLKKENPTKKTRKIA